TADHRRPRPPGTASGAHHPRVPHDAPAATARTARAPGPVPRPARPAPAADRPPAAPRLLAGRDTRPAPGVGERNGPSDPARRRREPGGAGRDAAVADPGGTAP